MAQSLKNTAESTARMWLNMGWQLLNFQWSTEGRIIRPKPKLFTMRPFGLVLKMGHYPLFLSLKAEF